MKLRSIIFGVLASLALVVVAQEAEGTTINVTESEEFGPYLTDTEGRTLYLFIDESLETDPAEMTEGVRANAAPCTEGCPSNWPPLTGEAQPGEGVNPDLLYTADVAGTKQVVYNGWPLYYFVQDTEAGHINGQGRGREPTFWYIVSPEGTPVEDE